MKQIISILMLAFSMHASAQDVVTIMHYNLLNYGNYTDYCTISNNSADNKDNYLKTIINYTLPDIFTVNEIDELTYYHQRILDQVLNTNGRTYYKRANSVNYANSYTTNMLYYDSRKFALHSQTVAQTYIRDIHVYKLYYKDPTLYITHDTAFITCLVGHLKAGSTTGDEQDRGTMTQNMMNYLNNIGSDKNYLFMGDFNVYASSEPAIQNITTHPNTAIRFNDPINKLGNWNNNSYYAPYHTQSTHVASSGCHSTGGMDDRFDFIMLSSKVLNGTEHYQYLSGSYKALGQDGIRFNGAINSPANTIVPYDIANALYDMSDHLPVILKLQIDQTPAALNEPTSLDQNIQVTYNNPVEEILKIKFFIKNQSDITLQIRSIKGEVMINKAIKGTLINNEIELDMTQAPSGIYLLYIGSSGSAIVKKIIKI